MDPALREIMALQSPTAEMEAIVKLAKPGTKPQGARVVTQFGDIATCRLQVADIEAVWSDEAVISLKAPRAVGVELGVNDQESIDDVPTRYNPTAFTGKGVVIGVVDWGFDFTHPNFLNPDGTTRFLAIWDQMAPADPSTRPYGYGKLYTRAAINEALKSETPFNTLGYHPAKGDPDGSCAHGTHVMGIAAGNDAVGEKGLAPGAELVGVHLSAGNTSGLASLGDSVRILEAIDFIGKVAGERPLVINLSVGKHGGAHQGNSLVEQGMDNFLQEKPGRAIINSAGNYFNAQIHASGRVMPGGSATLDWEVDKHDRTPNELEIWYPHRDKMRLKIAVPGTETPAIEVDLGGQKDIAVHGKTVGRAYHRAKEPNTGYNHIDIFLYKNAPKGDWQITLEGIDVVDGRWHAWIERDGGCRSCQSKFPTHTADPGFTTGSICNGLYTIAVGAYDNHDPVRKAAFFSSAGPTADGRKKPNLLAPGIGIRAACSARADAVRSNGELAVKSGTSMAAPHVTGAIALLFEAVRQPLPIETTRRLLLSSVDPPGKDAARAMYQYGEGYLNVESLIRVATNYSHHQKSSVMKHTPVYAHEEADTSFFNDREDWYEEDGEVLTPDELSYPEDGDEADSDMEAPWAYPEDVETEDFSAEVADDFPYESDGEDVFESEDFDVEFDSMEDPDDSVWEYESEENDRSTTDEVAYAEEKTDCGCGKHTSPDEAHRGQHNDCRECGEHIVGQAAIWMQTEVDEDFLSGFFAKTSLPAENYGLGNNRVSTAKNLFDRLAFGKPVPFTEAIDDDFAVVAYPKSLLTEPFLPGDVVLSRSFGEGKVWQAMAVSGTLLSRAQAVAAGLQPSSGKPGVYLEVVTVQPVIRHAGAGYAKRVGDEWGRLLADYLILRASPQVDTAASKTDLRNTDWKSMLEKTTSPVPSKTCGEITTGNDPTTGGVYKAGFTDIKITMNYPMEGGSFSVSTTMHVTYPAKRDGKDQPFASDMEKAPVVFLAHGNHGMFYNPHDRWDERGYDPGGFSVLHNHLGYKYFQDKLANLGIISASIDCNDLNGVGPSVENIRKRAYYVLSAIQTAQIENKRKGAILHQKFNFNEIGLFGHSRGAEAVLAVPTIVKARDISGIKISGIISLAPTDNRLVLTAPNDIPLMVILPAADGDVRSNDGAKFYDRHRPADFKTQLYIHRANHNYFNTEWIKDDTQNPPPILFPLASVLLIFDHMQFILNYGGAFFRKTLLNQHKWINILLGRQKPPGVNFSELHISAEKSPTLLVDDYEVGNITINSLTGSNKANAAFGGKNHDLKLNSTTIASAGISNSFYGDTKGMIAQTTASTQEMSIDLVKEKDLRGKEIWLRAAELFMMPIPSTSSEFFLGLKDSSGQTSYISVNQIGGLPHPFWRLDSFNKTMMKTFVFPTDCFLYANKNLKLNQIVAILIKHPNNSKIVYDQIQIN